MPLTVSPPGRRPRPTSPSSTARPRWPGLLAALLASLGLGACDALYPEVIVVNKTATHIQLRNLSFNGCLWNVVLPFGAATAPGRCLPGEDRIHFQKFDARAWADDQAAGEPSDVQKTEDGSAVEAEPDLANEEPTWFNYQTVFTRRVNYGDLVVIEVTLADMEQDFSVPGPYGH